LFAPLSQVVLATYGTPTVIAREFESVDGAQAVVISGGPNGAQVRTASSRRSSAARS
jgi:hypothetical protein